MTDNPNLVNIGTPERAMWVPRKALEPETPEGREWWGNVASGTVILDEEALGKLLDSEGHGKKGS